MTTSTPRTSKGKTGWEFNGLGCSAAVAGWSRNRQRAAEKSDRLAHEQERRIPTAPSIPGLKPD